jgi:hypothetical protein
VVLVVAMLMLLLVVVLVVVLMVVLNFSSAPLFPKTHATGMNGRQPLFTGQGGSINEVRIHFIGLKA